jgi:hypothetical protein
MKSVILLNSSENTHEVEEQEKTQFVRHILETMGLPIDKIWNEDNTLSIENKIKLRNILSTYNIQVIDDHDGSLQIYCDGEIIGRWDKCEYILKQDLKQKDPVKKLFLEMHTNHWSIFENME